MPTYDYRCKSCGHELEIFHSPSDKVSKTCPSCSSKRALERVFGAGGGVIFKGSGFYETDYKKSGATPAASKEAASCPKDGGPACSPGGCAEA